MSSPDNKPSTTTKPAASPAKSNNKEKKKKGFNWEIIKSPIFLGLVVTFVFLFIANNYYSLRSQQEGTRQQEAQVKQLLFQAIEWLDQKSLDGKFIIHGPEKPAEQVALLTIDDRSIEEIGRWPWSREKIAHVISEMTKYGATSIGFDIVFSEAQDNAALNSLNRIQSQAGDTLPAHIKTLFETERSKNDPDLILAQVLSQNKDKLVMGSFNEDSDDTNLKPYQDYCRNEAFKRANADKLVKLNATFIVNDEADPFVEIEFDQIFNPLFQALERAQTEKALKEIFHKTNAQQLNEYEQRQLSYLVQTEDMKFCDRWLTKDDPWVQDLKDQYLNIFKKSPLLANLPFEQALEKFKISTKHMPIVQHQRWTINTDKIQDAVDYTGSFNAEQDADGTIRRSSLFFRTGNRIGSSFIPSIALETYLIATGYRADIEINQDPKNPQQKIISKFNIVNPQKDPEELISQVPVDSLGRMPINYAGGKNMYAFLPAKELFNGKETALISQAEFNPATKKWNQKEFEVKKADFIKGKAFIFGATAIGVYDLRVTPFEKNYPGPETHVSALGNLFLKNFLKQYPKEHLYMMWALFLFGALLSIAISQTTAIPGFAVTFLSIFGVFAADQYFFQHGYLVSMTIPGVLIALLYVFLFFYKYLTEERKKKYLRSTFSKYVSPAIVDEILKDPENIELGGKKIRMSVFFSDVRGFTTISEKLDPQALSDVLNRYLTPMTQIVFANKGTLDKYMGDAVMAFFGAPIFFPDHAAHACRCALASIRKLKEIQIEFAAQGLPHIDIGIGINSADMSVGNMGSDIVRSYTVMGDAVNLGSRLEGINKEYGTRIIISQFTYEDVKNDFACREIDWVRVKGKLEPVRIFELISEGKAEEKTAQMVSFFQAGFNLYHEKKFSEALEQFNKALEINSEDPPAKIYVERCEDYIKEPPPENWDGVFTMKTK